MVANLPFADKVIQTLSINKHIRFKNSSVFETGDSFECLENRGTENGRGGFCFSRLYFEQSLFIIFEVEQGLQ